MHELLDVRGASKIKLKNVNKKRMATARRQIFFGISQGDSFADPCQFLPFLKMKILLSASLLHF
jgi:hypothetical protein